MWPEHFISVESLAFEVANGWVIRSMHRWTASLMVCFLVLHVFRVYPYWRFQEATRADLAYRHRVGGTHRLFRGYRLLPAVYDQTGYWAIRIVTGVPDALPIVGPLLVTLLRGGASVGQGTLSRFYTVHTLVLPLLATAALLVHFLLIRKQGISGPL